MKHIISNRAATSLIKFTLTYFILRSQRGWENYITYSILTLPTIWNLSYLLDADFKWINIAESITLKIFVTAISKVSFAHIWASTRCIWDLSWKNRPLCIIQSNIFVNAPLHLPITTEFLPIFRSAPFFENIIYFIQSEKKEMQRESCASRKLLSCLRTPTEKD